VISIKNQNNPTVGDICSLVTDYNNPQTVSDLWIMGPFQDVPNRYDQLQVTKYQQIDKNSANIHIDDHGVTIELNANKVYHNG